MPDLEASPPCRLPQGDRLEERSTPSPAAGRRRRRAREARGQRPSRWQRAAQVAVSYLGLYGGYGAAAQSLAPRPSAWPLAAPPEPGSRASTLAMFNGSLDLGGSYGVVGSVDFYHDLAQTYAGFQLFASPWHHTVDLATSTDSSQTSLSLAFTPVTGELGLFDVRDLASMGPERLPRCLAELGETYLNRMVGPIVAEGWFFHASSRPLPGVFNVSQQFNAALPLEVEIDNSTETFTLRVRTSAAATVRLIQPA